LGGPSGLIDNKTLVFSDEIIDKYRNTGGFDIIGSGRTKIETPEQFAASLDTAKKLGLDAVVIIGGDDSNTNAALLAEYFLENNCETQVIGCPKTIDGDLKNQYIETSFGFDTACKTYSELIGNLEKDVTASELRKHFEQFGEIIVSQDSCLTVSFFVIPFSIYRIISVSVSSHYVA
jgi:pyrophosphate--fructose-6-phosphate 1-phosphotransferase